MTRIAKLLIITYHTLFPSRIRVCRFEPTCSQYFLDALIKHGTVTGGILALKRLLSCHQFSNRPFYDPV